MLRPFPKPRLYSFSTAVLVIVTTIVTGYFSPAPSAEEELVKTLVGRWEGTAGTKGDTARILFIKAVKRQGDRWVAYGIFGTPKARGPVEITVTASGNDVLLDFDTTGNNSVRLKLAGENELDGQFRTFQTEGQGGAIIGNIKLKKIQ